MQNNARQEPEALSSTSLESRRFQQWNIAEHPQRIVLILHPAEIHENWVVKWNRWNFAAHKKRFNYNQFTYKSTNLSETDSFNFIDRFCSEMS